MSILIPTIRGIVGGTPRLIDFGGVQTPPGGGVAQRLNRIGNRFGIDIEMPSLDTAGDGRVVIARLCRALTEGGLFAFPATIDPGNPGAPVVNVGGQTGSTLNLRGFTPGYTASEGQFFSIIYGGRRYLHGVSADAAADSYGMMSLPIFPMLRISPNDGAVCEFATPYIEGFLSGNAQEWTLPASRYLNVKFTVTEAA